MRFEPDARVPVDVNYMRFLLKKHQQFLIICHGKKRTQLRKIIALASSGEVNLLLKIFYLEYHGAIKVKVDMLNSFSTKLMRLWKSTFDEYQSFSDFLVRPVQEKKKFLLTSTSVLSKALDPLF